MSGKPPAYRAYIKDPNGDIDWENEAAPVWANTSKKGADYLSLKFAIDIPADTEVVLWPNKPMPRLAVPAVPYVPDDGDTPF